MLLSKCSHDQFTNRPICVHLDKWIFLFLFCMAVSVIFLFFISLCLQCASQWGSQLVNTRERRLSVCKSVSRRRQDAEEFIEINHWVRKSYWEKLNTLHGATWSLWVHTNTHTARSNVESLGTNTQHGATWSLWVHTCTHCTEQRWVFGYTYTRFTEQCGV